MRWIVDEAEVRAGVGDGKGGGAEDGDVAGVVEAGGECRGRSDEDDEDDEVAGEVGCA